MKRNPSTEIIGQNRAKSGKILDNRAKSGKTEKLEKRPCLAVVVNKPTTSKDETIPEIPGVDQLDEVPAGSRPHATGFFDDEVALLTKRAKCVLDRTAIFIAPRIGWPKGIYWKEGTK